MSSVSIPGNRAGGGKSAEEFVDPRENRLLNSGLVTESGMPLDSGLLPEPRHLTFGVTARVALGVEHSFFDGQFAREHLQGLTVAVRLERFRRGRKASRENRLHFLDQAVFEHLRGAPVEPLVKQISRRRQPDLERTESLERVPPLTKQIGDRPPCEQTHLEGAYEL